MTAAIETALQRSQACLFDQPTLVLGSGLSASYGLAGMKALGLHLVSAVLPESEEEAGWQSFTKELETSGNLEQALQKSSLSDRLISQIVLKTWELISSQNNLAFAALLSNKKYLALSLTCPRFGRH